MPINILKGHLIGKPLLFFFADVLIISFSLYSAFLLRFEGSIPPDYTGLIIMLIFVFIPVKAGFFYINNVYRSEWKYVSLIEIISILKSGLYSLITLWIITVFIFGNLLLQRLPRSVLLIDFILCFLFISGFRLIPRLSALWAKRNPAQGERLLIVGAGDAGEQLIRNILDRNETGYVPVGFIDDDPAKRSLAIHGIKVIGSRKDIPLLVRRLNIETILIAIPSAPLSVIQDVARLAGKCGLSKIKILPTIGELIDGRIDARDIKDIKLEDLLRRQQVRIDTKSIELYLKGKSILVTGAAGSIGSEICRQIMRFSPKKIIMVDIDETRIFDVYKELKDKFINADIIFVVADIKDRVKMEKLFERENPQVIFHAGAYKHVPVMELYPEEAVKTNIFGTQVIAECAAKYGSCKFVLISTDKAVNPSSVMGATKSVAEMIVSRFNQKAPGKFVTVRFGNVLESRGNMFSIFSQQIRERRSVTVTDANMQRYLMSISEAVLLVLEAAIIDEPGDIFTLNMGKPVKIIDVVKAMIRLYGYEPDKDIPIVFTGIRPGEKLFEECLLDSEEVIKSKYDDILIAKSNAYINSDDLELYMDKLNILADQADKTGIIKLLQEMIPGYSK